MKQNSSTPVILFSSLFRALIHLIDAVIEVGGQWMEAWSRSCAQMQEAELLQSRPCIGGVGILELGRSMRRASLGGDDP
jgi:hypothetical protein